MNTRAAKQHGILIAVGDPDLQWRLARTLTVEGHRVVGTASADGALSLLAHWPVDLAIISEEVCGTMSATDLALELVSCDPGLHVALLGSETAAAIPSERTHAVRREPLDWELIYSLLGHGPAAEEIPEAERRAVLDAHATANGSGSYTSAGRDAAERPSRRPSAAPPEAWNPPSSEHDLDHEAAE